MAILSDTPDSSPVKWNWDPGIGNYHIGIDPASGDDKHPPTMTGIGFRGSDMIWLPPQWEAWTDGQQLTVRRTGRGIELVAERTDAHEPTR